VGLIFNCAPNKPFFSWAQNVPCPMSHNSLCFIEPHSSHRPFSLSHTSTTPFFTPFPTQTTHHPPTPHPILTNHTPLINSPYQSLTLGVILEPQPNIFLIPLNNAHVEPFPPSTLSALIVAHDKTSKHIPIFPTHLQPPPRASCPACKC
jgi:hypothetical protein